MVRGVRVTARRLPRRLMRSRGEPTCQEVSPPPPPGCGPPPPPAERRQHRVDRRALGAAGQRDAQRLRHLAELDALHLGIVAQPALQVGALPGRVAQELAPGRRAAPWPPASAARRPSASIGGGALMRGEGGGAGQLLQRLRALLQVRHQRPHPVAALGAESDAGAWPAAASTSRGQPLVIGLRAGRRRSDASAWRSPCARRRGRLRRGRTARSPGRAG